MVKNTYTQIKEIKEYAIINKVPIMQDEGIDFLTTFIIKHQIKNNRTRRTKIYGSFKEY